MLVLLTRLQGVRRRIGLPPARSGSARIRHVDAGSCNACEHELQALGNPFHDMERMGLQITASPRHADILLVTGPVTTRMREPLLAAHAAMPEPRRVVAMGDCPIACPAFCDPAEVAGPLRDLLPVDLEIPGCPPAPEVVAEALAGLLATMRAA